MSNLNRRDALKAMALAPVAAGVRWTAPEVHEAHRRMQEAHASAGHHAQAPEFFSEHEYETVKVLVDMIIPSDDRSGSATDAGVPEFMDFIMLDDKLPGLKARQTAMRGGLAWLDHQCTKRFDHPFVACSEAQRTELLDLIAWPEQAPEELSQGVEFFNAFRDLTASGFWTTKMGMEDLQYIGNTYVQEWTGCPDEVLDHLGLE